MRLRPLLSAAAVAAIGVSVLGAPAALAGSSTTWVVDDDGAGSATSCKADKPALAVVQDAIDAAGPGDTILVCPGTYTEQLTINGADGLTIRGVTPWKSQILSPADAPAQSLLEITESTGVTVQWLRFTSLATASDVPPAGPITCTQIESAIRVASSTDVTIRANHLDARGAYTLGACGYSVGIEIGELGSSGTAVASPAGLGPQVDLVQVKVVNNLVRDFQVAGVAAAGWRTHTDIVQNSLQFRHAHESDSCVNSSASLSAIAPRRTSRVLGALRAANVLPAGVPFSPECLSMGIVEMLGTRGTTRYNEIWSGFVNEVTPAGRAPAVLMAGIVEAAQGGLVSELQPEIQSSSDAPEVRGNRIRGAYGAIALIGGDNVRVVDNVARLAFAGVLVDQTHGARVTENRVRDTYFGLWVEDEFLPIDFDGRTSEGNAFRRNTIADPVGDGFDLDRSCWDTTTGAGTLGTANTWSDNTAPAGSSDPSGICGAPAAP